MTTRTAIGHTYNTNGIKHVESLLSTAVTVGYSAVNKDERVIIMSTRHGQCYTVYTYRSNWSIHSVRE